MPEVFGKQHLWHSPQRKGTSTSNHRLLRTQKPSSSSCKCVFSSPRFWISSLSAQPPPLVSPSEVFWLEPQGWVQLPHDCLASSMSVGRCPTACRGSSVPLGHASGRLSCPVARDVFSCTRVESEPTTVQPRDEECLLWSRSRVWFEEYRCAERGDLLFEQFASDALLRCHPVASDMDCR